MRLDDLRLPDLEFWVFSPRVGSAQVCFKRKAVIKSKVQEVM